MENRGEIIETVAGGKSEDAEIGATIAIVSILGDAREKFFNGLLWLIDIYIFID